MTVTEACLREIPIFAGLSQVQLAQVANTIVKQRCKPRAVLFEEGQPYSGLHVVAAGRVAMGRRREGRDQILAILGPGELLDIAPLVDGGPHICRAWALEFSFVYCVLAAVVWELLEASPAFRRTFLTSVAARLREQARVVSELALKDVVARLAGLLLQCAQKEGVKVENGLRINRRLTVHELAARTGTVREVAQRNLRRLQEARLIAREEGRIVILDPDGLHRWAEEDQPPASPSVSQAPQDGPNPSGGA